MTTGLLLAASSTHLYQFILTQGILFGVGSSFLYLPPVVCTPIFFNKHRAIAMGIVYSGTGFGGLVIATLTRYLIDEYGWRWCLRTLALINLVATILASLLLVVPEHQEFRSNNKLFNISQVGSYRVWLQMAGTLLQSAGYLIPLFFMSKYAETLGFSKSQGAMFIGVNNAINAVFKIILGFGADYIGRLNMIIICSLASSISIFALWMVETRATFLSFVVVYGIFSGAIISILPACLVELFGVGNYQALNGLMTFGRGVGNMLGSPVAGLLIVGSGAYSSAYRNCIIYNGVLLFASTFFLSGLWLATTLERGKKSWIL
jgi:Arabinose efflux permease